MNTTTKTRPTTKAKAPAAKKPSTRRKAEPPAPPAPATSGSIEMPALLLKKVLSVVTPAASTDEARPVLCNVAIDVGENSTTWMATDSYRLHHLNLTADEVESGDTATGQVPAWWLQRWARGKFAKHDTVRLSWTPTSATIACNGMTDTIAFNTAPFPNAKSILEKASADPTQQIAHFSPRYLAVVLACCAKWGHDGYYAPVRLNPIAPGLFTARSTEGLFTGLLMPVRVP